MNDESKKTLVIGMLSGLLITLEKHFTDEQQRVYKNAFKIINEVYYPEDKTQ